MFAQTAHAITAVIYFLVTEDPRIMMTLRKEIFDAVGPSKTVPTFEQIKEMKYLRAVAHGQSQSTTSNILIILAHTILESLRDSASPAIRSGVRESTYMMKLIWLLNTFFLIHRNIRNSVNDSVWTNPSTGVRYFIPKNTRWVCPPSLVSLTTYYNVN